MLDSLLYDQIVESNLTYYELGFVLLLEREEKNKTAY
jgi:hypothetical protein